MKKIVRSCLFLFILIALLGALYHIFRFKFTDGIYNLDAFYREKNDTVDVLVLGSSHAFQNINTAVLYDKFGIAAFDLGGSSQPFWNTFFYLKEALKTQTPKLIILEAYAAAISPENTDSSRIIKNNYGLRWSRDKIDSIKVSQQESGNYLFEWLYCHSRYEEISKQDFGKYLGKESEFKYWKGFWCNYQIKEFQKPDITVIENVQMTEKQEKYYRMIIELANNANIPLLIMVAPYSGYNAKDAGYYKHAQSLAKEYDIPFINYNEKYDELGMDFTIDFADSGHLSYLGNQKFTEYLGNYIFDKYSLTDRRNNAIYDSWKRNAEYFYQTITNLELGKTEQLKDYLENLEKMDANYVLVLSCRGNIPQWVRDSGAVFSEIMEKDKKEGLWVIRGSEVLFYADGKEDYFYHVELKDDDLAVQGNMGQDEVVINRNTVFNSYNGISICVWDTLTEELVDNVRFELENGWVARR